MESTKLQNPSSRERAEDDSRREDISAATLTPLTGRDTEVSLLGDRWEQAQEGMGQVVLIVGEAGLGKSRLVLTAKEIALRESEDPSDEFAQAGAVVEWRCSQRTQHTELHPVAEYLARLLNFRNDESPAARFDRLAQYLETCGLARPETVALLAKLLFLPPDQRYPASGLTPIREREETFRVLREWLRACSRRQPVLFVIEDLHWIDASSLEFLGQFIAEGLHDRILTLLTFRPEFSTPWPAVAHQTSLALNRLTRRHVTEWFRRSTNGALPTSLVAQIYERTGGVPLLVEEFIRMARESIGFEHTRADEVPATLQQLIMARLDRMASNREIAQFAATLGREFEYEMLAAVVSVDEETLQVELGKLVEAEILFSKGAPPRCAYLFKHALLEEALHNALETTQRQQFHRQIAEAIESRFPYCAENQPELLALHYSEAGLVDRAVEYWLKAGRRSQARFANVEAISHLTRGLELLRTLEESAARDSRELELLGPLGTAYIAARGYAAPEVGPIFQRACKLAERIGEPEQTFTMLRGNFAFHIVRGNFRLCSELAAQAMQFAVELGDPGVLMEALFLQGLTQLYRGYFSSAHECFTRALATYDDRVRTAYWATRTGEDSGVTHRCYLALACWYLGSTERAFALNREARDLARSLHHPFSLEYALHHTGWLCQHCRFDTLTKAAGDEEARIATEQGFQFWHASGTLYSGAGLLLRGRTEEGLQIFQAGLEAYRATGARLALPYYLGIQAEALVQMRRFEEARRVFDEAFALMEENDDRFNEAELHRLRGELHLAEANDAIAAEASFRRAIEIARRQQSRAWELRATFSLAKLWHHQRRTHEAFTALSAAFAVFSDGLESPDLTDAAALLDSLRNERMRDDLAAGMQYVRACIPPPITQPDSPVQVDWRYIPSTNLGGDTLGYHWLNDEQLAFYLLDVTGHGVDSALLAVTITGMISSGSLAGADLRQPDQVLAALNQLFQGSRHGRKYFTLWYGVYHVTERTLTYASGGHPSAVLLTPGEKEPRLFPATGPIMGISPGTLFPATTSLVAPGARLLIFSDGVYELRREKHAVWNLPDCIAYLTDCGQREESVMDTLLDHARELRGSPHLDDDFSFIEAFLR